MVQGRVRWKRFALVFVPALAVASVLVGATAEGAIGASFVVSGDTFKVSADTLQGQGFVQYGSTVENKKGQKIPVAVSGIRKATLTNMCQTVLVKSPVGAVTIRITMRHGQGPVTAENMIVDATQIEGNAVFTKLEAGRDASALDQLPDGQGASGMFGQQAAGITIKDFRQVSWAVNAATFKLPGLKLAVEPSTARVLLMERPVKWRRSRPFWGGLLVLAAGLELLSIPFATQALPLVIQSGTVGATYLIALVLIILGLMVWLQPGQRAFLGVVAVLVSIASFVYANLGGFLIGMLLGLVGGALAVAWTPAETTEAGTAPAAPAAPPALSDGGITFTERRVVSGDERLEAARPQRPAEPADESPRILVARVKRDADPAPDAPDAPGSGGGADEDPDDGGGGVRPDGGGRGDTGPGPGAKALAIAVLPVILAAGTALARDDPGTGGQGGSGQGGSLLPGVLPSAVPSGLSDVLGGVLPSTLPTALPTALPTKLPTKLPTDLEGAVGSLTGRKSPSPSPGEDGDDQPGAPSTPGAVRVATEAGRRTRTLADHDRHEVHRRGRDAHRDRHGQDAALHHGQGRAGAAPADDGPGDAERQHVHLRGQRGDLHHEDDRQASRRASGVHRRAPEPAGQGAQTGAVPERPADDDRHRQRAAVCHGRLPAGRRPAPRGRRLSSGCPSA